MHESSAGVMPSPGCPLEERHVEAAVRHMAFLVMQYGEALVPLFEQFEADLVEIRRRRSPIERARAILNAQTLDGRLKAIGGLDG